MLKEIEMVKFACTTCGREIDVDIHDVREETLGIRKPCACQDVFTGSSEVLFQRVGSTETVHKILHPESNIPDPETVEDFEPLPTNHIPDNHIPAKEEIEEGGATTMSISYSDEKKQAIIEDFKSGMELSLMRIKHSTNDSMIYKVINEAGIKKRGRRGARKGKGLLAEATESEKRIISRYNSGDTLTVIIEAEKLTDHNRIYDVLRKYKIPLIGNSRPKSHAEDCQCAICKNRRRLHAKTVEKPQPLPATPPGEEIVDNFEQLPGMKTLEDEIGEAKDHVHVNFPPETNPAQAETIRQVEEVLQRADEMNPEKDDTKMTPDGETAGKVDQNVAESGGSFDDKLNSVDPLELMAIVADLLRPTVIQHPAIQALLEFLPALGTPIDSKILGALTQYFEATLLLMYDFQPNGNGSAKRQDFSSFVPPVKGGRK